MATATPGAAPAAGAQQTLVERLKIAFARADRDQCKPSLALLRPILDEAEFASLPDRSRAAVYLMAAVCAFRLADNAAAYRYAVAGTALKAADPQLWAMRFGVEVDDRRYAQAVTTLEAMSAQAPDALNAMTIRGLYALNRGVRQDSDKTLRRRVLTILSAPAYQPDEIGASADGFRRDYAAMLADAGRKDEAAAMVARIEEPLTLISMSVDPRLRAMLPADFDGRAATERFLAREREVAASHPGSMAAVLQVSRYLRLLGRFDESLATLEAARPDGAQGVAFTDLADQRNWWWDEMARNHQIFGHYDDAVAAFRKGIDAKESGALNVSQTINLASAQRRFHRPAEALETVAAFDTAKHGISPYGEIQLRAVRVCAHFALDQAEAAKADLAYAVAHERDAPGTFVEFPLCAGDLDGAAAAIIRRLDDPDEKAAALLQLSDFDPPPATYPRLINEERLPALKLRPDVQDAIRRAGGIRHFHVQDF